MIETKLKPGKMRAFFVGLPRACGVPDDVAEIYEYPIGRIFDLEKRNPESVFARQFGQTVAERLAPAFDGWIRFAKDLDAAEYAKELSEYAASVDLFRRKGEGSQVALDHMREYLEADEPSFPAVSALLTVAEASDASVDTAWD